MLVQAANFRKKFGALAIQHLRVLLNHAKCGVSRFKWVDERKRGKSSGAQATQNMERDAPWTDWSKMLQLLDAAASLSSSPITNHK
jgi:hypothetical protein